MSWLELAIITYFSGVLVAGIGFSVWLHTLEDWVEWESKRHGRFHSNTAACLWCTGLWPLVLAAGLIVSVVFCIFVVPVYLILTPINWIGKFGANWIKSRTDKSITSNDKGTL